MEQGSRLILLAVLLQFRNPKSVAHRPVKGAAVDGVVMRRINISAEFGRRVGTVIHRLQSIVTGSNNFFVPAVAESCGDLVDKGSKSRLALFLEPRTIKEFPKSIDCLRRGARWIVILSTVFTSSERRLMRHMFGIILPEIHFNKRKGRARGGVEHGT